MASLPNNNPQETYCLSETATTSVTKIPPNHVDLRMEEGQVEVQELSERKKGGQVLQPMLDLNLYPVLDLIGDMDDVISSQQQQQLSSSLEGVAEPEPRVFGCNYCKRKFYNSQALGGHQNAHKRERSMLLKRGRQTISAHDQHQLTMQKNSSMSFCLPLHSSFSGSAIKVHSMVHKPPFGESAGMMSGVGLIYGYCGHACSQPYSIEQKLATGLFQMVARVTRYGEAAATTGGQWWPGSVGEKGEFQKLELSLKL